MLQGGESAADILKRLPSGHDGIKSEYSDPHMGPTRMAVGGDMAMLTEP